MAQMKFNLSQVNNPTPANVGRLITLISAVLGALVAWTASTNIIPHPADDIVNSILGLAGLVINAIRPFFGMEGVTKTVPSSEVTEMEEPKKNS